MSAPDTSTATVERMAARADRGEVQCEDDIGRMLRVLAAERDEAVADKNQWQANSRENKMIAESNMRELDAARAEVAALREALAWYGEQARLARLIHSEGDPGRHALAEDGGKRAKAILAGAPPA